MRRSFLGTRAHFTKWGLLGSTAALLPLLPALPSPMVSVAGAQQINPDEAALLMLSSAQKAYNEKNYPFAADRFRDFIRTYGGRKEMPAAQYGLALSLLEAQDKNLPDILNALQQPANTADFYDRPVAIYYLGVTHRLMGAVEYRLAAERPNEAPQHLAAATARFDEASRDLTTAVPLFADRCKPAIVGGPPAAPTVDDEWLARARCDLAEMLLRANKFKEAKDAIAPFVSAPASAQSKYFNLGLYHLGYANFALKDYRSAGRTLSKLAPFNQEFGLHARYLLARVHHLSGERAEAAIDYKAVVTGYDDFKKASQTSLQNPAALTPERKLFLESVVNGQPPDYFVRANFYSNVMLAESGKYADALTGFNLLLQQNPKSPLAPEAQLRAGFCQMQSRVYPEAMRFLEPLRDHPQFSDQALWFIGRIQVATADPANQGAYAQSLNTAADTFRRAAERANQLGQTDPDAKARRADILLELADTLQAAKQYQQAAATYSQVQSENANPDRNEEALQRQVTALHLLGQFPQADELAVRFQTLYPRSTLMGDVLFRRAEGAYLAAVIAAGVPNRPKAETDPLFNEAVKRYQVLLDKYPEFPQINLARQGLANAYYQLGQYDKTQATLNAIPASERSGELAAVSYLLADCLIRTLPPESGDALSAERVIEQCGDTVKLLTSFLAADPKGPQAPDALLKLGHCYQRIAALLADPVQRKESFTSARAAYERVINEFNQSPAMPVVVFERARCLAEMGDVGSAIGEFNRFANDPFHASPVAPMAMLRLSVLLRGQNKAVEAMALMARCREQFEIQLYADPQRAAWVPMIQYEQGMAQKEAGKLPEARSTFDILARQFAKRPEGANAQWRSAQCRREELVTQLDVARKAAAKPDAKPEEVAAAGRTVESLLANIRTAATTAQTAADGFAATAPGSEAHQRLLYEVAWCDRVLADAEIELANQKMRREALKRLQDKAAKDMPVGQKPTIALLPHVPIADVPIQPAEQAARDQYKKVIDASVDSSTAGQARLELAEMLSTRGENDAALNLLFDALEHDPSAELSERIRLRMAACFLGRHEPKEALSRLKPPGPMFTSGAAADPAAPPPPPPQPAVPTQFTMNARYLSGEAYVQLQDWPKALEQLQVFRDQDPYRNAPDIVDRALLRLGYAFAQSGNWDQSRASYEVLIGRFPQSPLLEEARYGVAWAYQNQKQWDNAINTYAEITRRTAAEVAARAQLQLGLCQLEASRFPDAARSLVAVAYTYDYAEYSAAGQCEAARAYVQMKQPREATKTLKRVIESYPASKWAQTARERLASVPAEPPPANVH